MVMKKKLLVTTSLGDVVELQEGYYGELFMNWKREWTELERVIVMRSILLWLNSRKFETKHYGVLKYIHTIGELYRLFGFPYTSSGSAAGVWVTNTELYLDMNKKFYVYGFQKDTAGIIYAICHDNNENELLIPINK